MTYDFGSFPPLPELLGISEKMARDGCIVTPLPPAQSFTWPTKDVIYPKIHPADALSIFVWPGEASASQIRRLTEQLLHPRLNFQILAPDHMGEFPVMRELIRDSGAEWILWLRGDVVLRTTAWYPAFKKVLKEAEDDIGCIGQKTCHQLSPGPPDPRNWFREASWYRGEDFRMSDGREGANGDMIYYPAPGFIALRREAALACDIPDRRVGSTGGEIVIGEQLHQGGYRIKAFDTGNIHVRTFPNALGKYPWS